MRGRKYGAVLFFSIVGIDDFSELKKLTVHISMRLCTSLQYLREMPIEDLLEVADEIIKAQGGGE